MIPLTERQYLVVNGERGRTYMLKYLTALDDQVEYHHIVDREQADIKNFVDKAKSEFPEGDKENINLRAYELLSAHRRENLRDYLGMCNDYINLFVVGWSGEGLLEFPGEGKPADSVKLYDKYKLYRIIQDHIDELTGLVFDEVKN